MMAPLSEILSGLDAARLADLRAALGVDRVTLWRWKKGKARPAMALAAGLLAWLEGQGIAADMNSLYASNGDDVSLVQPAQKD